MQYRLLVQNRRVKRPQCFSIEDFRSKISSAGWLEKSWPAGVCVCVCMYGCPSVQAFSPLETERLVRSGRANIHSMRRNGGKTLKTVLDRSVARGTCHVRPRKPLQKSCSAGCRPNQWTDLAQTWWSDSHCRWAQALG